MRIFVLAALVALAAACNPSVPSVDPDHELDAAPPDGPPIDGMPEEPIAPPGTAMETLSGAGRLTAGSYTLDVQIGGFTRGTTAAGDATLDTAPVLH